MNIINSSDIMVEGLRYDFRTPGDIVIRGTRSQGIRFVPEAGESLAPHVLSGEEVASTALSFDSP